MSVVAKQTHVNASLPAKERRNKALSSAVQTALDLYFNDLDGHAPGNLYEMVLCEVERPLLQAALKHTRGNQCNAAKILGINRSTLRKKLQQYGIE